MDVLTSIDRLDGLILENTKPPATATMRNQLSHVREQVEAVQSLYSALKNEHTVLKNTSDQQIAELNQKNEELVAKQEKSNESVSRETAPNLAENTKNVLRLFFKQGEITVGWVSQTLGMEEGMAEYHMDALKELKFIIYSSGRALPGGRQIRYFKILPAGRKYAVENGLI
jgi:DNA-directed RNA polymerase specialized sigma subunit